MMSINLDDIAILNIRSVDYRCVVNGISKSKTVNLLQNADLSEKKGNTIKHKNLLSHIKICKEVTTFGDIEVEKRKFHCYRNPFFKII